MSRGGILALLAAALFAMSQLCAGEDSSAKGTAGVGKLTHRIVLDVEYPVTGQAKVDRLVQEWLEKKIEKTIRSFAGVALDPDMDESTVTLSVGFQESRASDRVVSYVFELYSYPSRAAHPMTHTYVLNIDLDKRERLGFDDIFAHPKRALKILSEKAPEAVRKDLAERLPEQFKNGDADSVLFMEGFEPKKDNFKAIRLEPNGVRVIFQPYQVAPYVYGKPEAFIPLSDLEDAGPRHGLWDR